MVSVSARISEAFAGQIHRERQGSLQVVLSGKEVMGGRMGRGFEGTNGELQSFHAVTGRFHNAPRATLRSTRSAAAHSCIATNLAHLLQLSRKMTFFAPPFVPAGLARPRSTPRKTVCPNRHRLHPRVLPKTGTRQASPVC